MGEPDVGNKLYVGNLSRTTTDRELEQAFAPFGEVKSVQIIMDRMTGESKGFGFVEMANDQQAQAAIAGMNLKELGGRSVSVSEARPKPDGGGGGGGRGRFGGRR